MRKCFFLLYVLLLPLLCGCFPRLFGGETPAPQPTNAIELTAFCYAHRGMSSGDEYTYSAQKAENGTQLYLEMLSGTHIIDVVVDDPVLEELGEIAGQYRLDLWDGFNETNTMMLDGTGFFLSMTLADGSTVSAQGSNAFPAGYSDAASEIRNIFGKLIQAYAEQ